MDKNLKTLLIRQGYTEAWACVNEIHKKYLDLHAARLLNAHEYGLIVEFVNEFVTKIEEKFLGKQLTNMESEVK